VRWLPGWEFGHDHLPRATEHAREGRSPLTVSPGACVVAVVRHLPAEAGLHKPSLACSVAQSEPVDAGALARYDRPLLNLASYDTLLSGPGAGTA
jgi:hypothetical protein